MSRSRRCSPLRSHGRGVALIRRYGAPCRIAERQSQTKRRQLQMTALGMAIDNRGAVDPGVAVGQCAFRFADDFVARFHRTIGLYAMDKQDVRLESPG